MFNHMINFLSPIKLYIDKQGIEYTLDHKNKTAVVSGYINVIPCSIVIPNTIDFHKMSYKVIGIADLAFYRCDTISIVTILDGLCEIGQSAFKSCYNLEKVILCDSITVIKSQAFQSCYSLHSINLPKYITELPSRLFEKCYRLEHIDIPDSVRGMGLYIFLNCNSLSEVKIPEKLSYVMVTNMDIKSDIRSRLDCLNDLFCCFLDSNQFKDLFTTKDNLLFYR